MKHRFSVLVGLALMMPSRAIAQQAQPNILVISGR